ncbi:unnamed protein product [Rotaria sp. Silwood1]|nr:unnamed protein product [Rotaria sp. Silwood1]
MPRLNQFTFSIHSFLFIRNEMNFLSTQDIQRTFIDFPNNIISYVEFLPETKQSLCHIYSYPSVMQYYGIITNNFPGGLFEYVRVISLFDEYPFEHDFFLRIQKSFPFMETLSLNNYKSQNDKQSYQSNNDNRNLSLIKYSFLNELYIINVHDDYIKEFLFDTKTCFQNNVDLHIKYESLERVTQNFTRDATRINCAKINTTDSIASSYCPFDQRKQNEFYQSTGDEITKLQQQNFHHLLSNVESTYSSNDNYLSKYTIDDNNSQISNHSNMQ